MPQLMPAGSNDPVGLISEELMRADRTTFTCTQSTALAICCSDRPVGGPFWT